YAVVRGRSGSARRSGLGVAAPPSSVAPVSPHVSPGGRNPRGSPRHRPLHARGVLGLHEVRAPLGERGQGRAAPRERLVRVAFVGGFDPEYPRTRGLREGLQARGVEVRMLAISARAGFGTRQAAMIAAWVSRGAGVDAFLVPSFGHRDVPLLRLLAHASGAPLLFDPLVSRWDTQVRDVERVRAGSFSALRLRLSDRVSMGLADIVLCDTWEHGEFFSSEFGVARQKIARVPVGADREAFA